MPTANILERLAIKEISHVRRVIVISVILVMMMVVPIGAVGEVTNGSHIGPRSSHDFWLGPLTHQTYTFHCQEGDTLSGSFTVTTDGDHFIYDQKKYDLWPGWGDGIDLYLLDEGNSSLWMNGEDFTALYAMNDLTTFSWSIVVARAGTLTVVYDNDSSVYGKQVEGSIVHFSREQNTNNTIMLVGFASLLFAILILVRRTLRAK
ncbi:MAG: hypothetical protein ACW99U_18685 [Candidatus Thorarchaeota archaeon]|jgi:hypothetical protein